MIQIPRQKKSKKDKDHIIIEQGQDLPITLTPPTIAESFDIIEKDPLLDIGNIIPREAEEDEEEIEHLTEDELENIVDSSNITDLDDENEEIILPAITPQELPINTDTNNEHTTVEELEKEREYARRLKVLEFLREYAKDINRNVDEVAFKVSISVDTARKNLNEYIDVVKDTISKKTYPDGLLMYYNADVEEKDKEKRIKYHHLNSLKDLVKRYSKFDINKTLNSNGSDTFISNKSVSVENNDDSNNLSLLGRHNNTNWHDGPGQQQQQQQTVQQPQSEYNDIDRLKDGITSMQLIRFGLGNIFGPTARMKICNVMGYDTTPYLMDEQRMKELLLMSGATDTRATQFINWLKINARYVTHPIGFLAANIPNSGGQGQDQQVGQNNYYMNGGGNGHGNGSKRAYGPNAMDDYYYQTRVYTEGYPPDHPVNQEALRNHLEQKRQDDQLKAVDKQLNMAIRMQMMKSLGTMDGSGGGNNHNSLFSPEMMVMMGMARWRSNGNDENGKPIFVIEPTFGQPPMGGNGIGGVTNPTDSTTQMTAMVTMMKEMMQLATSMNKSDPTQQSFMQTVMQGLASKMFEPPTNKMQEVIQTAELLQKLKGPESTVSNMGGITDPNVIIRTKRMELDKEFGMRRLDLEKQELDLQRERLAMQDREASQNMDKIIEGVQEFAPMLVGMFQQFFMGNRNGQPGGQPGIGPQGGGMIPGQETNPANLILKMEYEKQRQRQQEEAMMRQREWEEELRRKNIETEMMRARSQIPNQSQQPQNPESQRVIIEQPKTGYVTIEPEDKQQSEGFTEDTFLPYSSRELEEVLNKAAREKKKLEEYINTVGKVYQNKIMGGNGKDEDDDYDLEIVENEGRKITPQNNPNTQKQKQEQQEPNFDEILDSYSKKRIDPDYDGVLDDTTEEVEIEPQDNFIDDENDEQEGEAVEI